MCRVFFRVVSVSCDNSKHETSYILCIFIVCDYFFRKKAEDIIFYIFYTRNCITHYISSGVCIIYNISSRVKLSEKLILFIGFIALLIFNALISFIIAHGLLGAATYKLMFYTTIASDGYNLGYLKFFIIMCMASYFFFSDKFKNYKSLIWYGSLLYAILIPIPILSQRLLLLLVAFLNGYLMFFRFIKY